MINTDTAARDIIATANLTPTSTRDAIYDAIESYCDDPATTRMTMHRIFVRIEQALRP